MRILFDRILHLGSSQILLVAKGLGFDAGLGNAVFDQERLGQRDTSLGECLVIRHGASRVSVTGENQVRVRLALQILLEVASQRG